MQAKIDALETKIAQMLERYQGMHNDNIKLRQQVVSLENTNKRLNERLEEARARMEDLYNKLPD